MNPAPDRMSPMATTRSVSVTTAMTSQIWVPGNGPPEGGHVAAADGASMAIDTIGWWSGVRLFPTTVTASPHRFSGSGPQNTWMPAAAEGAGSSEGEGEGVEATGAGVGRPGKDGGGAGAK